MRNLLTAGEKLAIVMQIVFASISFGKWQHSVEAGAFIFFLSVAALWLVVPDDNAK